MPERESTPATARAIVDAIAYMTIATADADGRPWASPVYFAHAGYSELYWVSRPTAQHSRNIETRHEIAAVVFDSRIPIGSGQAVYMPATADRVEVDADLASGIEVFSRRLVGHGQRAWTLDDVTGPAELRLYRATVTAHYVLAQERDERVPVTLT